MAIRGIGQAPDSPVTGTAAWLSSICAVMSKDPWYGPIINDPFAIHFAGAISDQAPALLAEFDDPAKRQALIDGHGTDLGTFTVVCYRKPQMQRQVREALDATGARQLVILGAGCDSLSLRLAAEGYRPQVYEIDRPAVTDFRARVLRTVPIDASHIKEVGVDFDHQVFGQVLLDAGYDPTQKAVFFAEGLLGYVSAEGVDDIFRFIKEKSAPGSRFVFSFTENRRLDAANRVKSTDVLSQQGETPQFDLPPAQAKAFVEARGYRLLELLTAEDLKKIYKTRHEGRIAILPFLHLAVAET